MKIFINWLLLICVCVILLCACGPSQEAIATMTASVWTPTPEPTLTPTPIPYDLDVIIAGENGQPVLMGTIAINAGEEMALDQDGKASFRDLGNAEVTISITAQGFEPVEETFTTERGMNEKSIYLVRDPLQIDPANACLQGQNIVVVEDFEDQKLQGWEGQLARPMWDYVSVDGRGTVLSADRTAGEEYYLVFPVSVGNMVWHYEILREPGPGVIWMRFHQIDGRGSYIAVVDGDIGFGIQKEPGAFLANRYINASDGVTWEKFSIVYFDGTINLYYNDELFLGVDDIEPYADGQFSIGMTQSDGSTSFDNIVVCELSEPYIQSVIEAAEQ